MATHRGTCQARYPRLIPQTSEVCETSEVEYLGVNNPHAHLPPEPFRIKVTEPIRPMYNLGKGDLP
jgi:hypothetical protein